MERITLTPRPDWQQKVEESGLIWHTLEDGTPYWNESACYVFTPAQIEKIEAATAELYDLFLKAGQHVIDHDLFHLFGIPDWVVPLIKKSWDDEPPALNYGRFDLGYDGVNAPKLFEFNCDTPTSLLEAAVVQWAWKEEVFPDNDQFTSLHDKLVAKWEDIAPYLGSSLVHFTNVSDMAGEDAVTVAYLQDTAAAAGLDTVQIDMRDIGFYPGLLHPHFQDLAGVEMKTIYKLYPWEWIVNEPFGKNLTRTKATWLEPIWKMIWSNKAILPILWKLFPGHPNLLPAAFGPLATDCVKKPKLAREGANITIISEGQVVSETGGDYGEEGYIHQALFDLPDFVGNRPVIGSWVVDGEPAGMGIREDGLITGNTARFVPHIIR